MSAGAAVLALLAVLVVSLGAPSASAENKSALDAFEGGGALEPVLVAARADDAVSLWNLIARVDGERRVVVVARLSMRSRSVSCSN